MSTSRLGAAPKPASADDEGFKRELVLLIPHLRAFARTLTGDPTAADDLAQDAMMKAWDARASYQMGTNMKAWTFMILRNQFYTDLRKTRREVEDVDGTHAGQMTSPSDQEDASTLKVVWEKIGRLPEGQRQALLLVGAEGRTYEEAATLVPGAKKVILPRAAGLEGKAEAIEAFLNA